MTGPEEPRRGEDIVEDARAEIAAMAKEGLRHPSTKPVLTGAAAGAVAGALLPVVSLPLGLIIGAGFMFYKRLRP
ncbi:hypothetical protein GCM10009127_19090 [Alteraurantiacibacter aestuarii]|uniref:hypothetical protein n=1 Tax=Alteraurantiacibacter aestuarii TaxID=650004 RepID=UPI0031D7A581